MTEVAPVEFVIACARSSDEVVRLIASGVAAGVTHDPGREMAPFLRFESEGIGRDLALRLVPLVVPGVPARGAHRLLSGSVQPSETGSELRMCLHPAEPMALWIPLIGSWLARTEQRTVEIWARCARSLLEEILVSGG